MTNEFIQQLILTLEPAARAKFNEIDQFLLAKSMELCHMVEYPPIIGEPHGERASGDCICEICQNPYYAHPYDWRLIGYGDIPFLNILCNGQRVKL